VDAAITELWPPDVLAGVSRTNGLSPKDEQRCGPSCSSAERWSGTQGVGGIPQTGNGAGPEPHCPALRE